MGRTRRIPDCVLVAEDEAEGQHCEKNGIWIEYPVRRALVVRTCTSAQDRAKSEKWALSLHGERLGRRMVEVYRANRAQRDSWAGTPKGWSQYTMEDPDQDSEEWWTRWVHVNREEMLFSGEDRFLVHNNWQYERAIRMSLPPRPPARTAEEWRRAKNPGRWRSPAVHTLATVQDGNEEQEEKEEKAEQKPQQERWPAADAEDGRCR